MPELPKIVTQRLQAKVKDLVHPDPDLITAFVENSLPQSDRNQVLEHVAHCSECREVVSLSLPQHSEGISASARPAASSWLSWPALRWGALAVCVVMVGAAVMLRHESRSRPEGLEIPAMNQKAAQVPASSEGNRMEAANQIAIQPPGATGNALSAPAARLHVKKALAKPTTEDKQLSAQVVGELHPSVPQTGAADVSTAAEAAPSSPSASVDELVPGRTKDVPLESQPANAMAGIAARVQAKPKMAMSAVAMNKAAYPAAMLVPRWTLTSDGTLQRSLDSGATWEAVSVPSQATLRALAADGLDIWVGGSNGALYHSSDAGQHWMQVRPIANGELLSADIIGVEFTDLQHGTLTTSAKETWTTSDAGQTWQKK